MKTHYILFSLFLLFCGTVCQGQELKRRVVLGIQMSPLSEEKRKEADYSGTNGIFIDEVMPDGTFKVMGIKKGSILQELNGVTIESLNDVGKALKGVKAGTKIKAVVFKDGKTDTFNTEAIGRPHENHPDAELEYGSVRYEDNTLRSLLYLPKGVKNPPVVFFIQGYTCVSIEMGNNNPVKQLINGWIKNGYAVYLAEKPGMGDSECKTGCMDIDFNEELEGFSEAYKALQKNQKVDTNNIFLFGHSMGGIIAPLLAAKHKPKGITVFGIVGKSWYDYMIDVYTEQQIIFGASEEEVETNKKYNLPFLKDLLINKKTNSEMVSNAVYGEHLKKEGLAEPLAEGYYLYRHYRFWQTLADIDVPGAWAKVKCPVYVMHGEYDIQAIHPRYGEMIVTQVKKQKGDAEFKMLPKTEHVMMKFDSREEQLRAMGDGTYRQKFAENFNPEITKYSLEWMNSKIQKP